MTSEQAGVNLSNPITFGRGREKARQTNNAYLTLVTPGDSFEHRDKNYTGNNSHLANCGFHICNRNPAQLLTASNRCSHFLQASFSQTPCDRVQIQWEVPEVTSENCNSVAFVPSKFGRPAAFLWVQSLNS